MEAASPNKPTIISDTFTPTGSNTQHFFWGLTYSCCWVLCSLLHDRFWDYGGFTGRARAAEGLAVQHKTQLLKAEIAKVKAQLREQQRATSQLQSSSSASLQRADAVVSEAPMFRTPQAPSLSATVLDPPQGPDWRHDDLIGLVNLVSVSGAWKPLSDSEANEIDDYNQLWQASKNFTVEGQR
jgi:hypothetical protein